MPQKTKSLIRLSVFTVRAEFSNFHFLFGEEASRTIFFLATNDELNYESQNVRPANARIRQHFGASLRRRCWTSG